MIDRVFGNRYRVIERIGLGGMAEVYRATDEVLGRTVALKLMLPQYAADPTFAARFKQEAQAAANLQSPYIVNIYDWGRDDTDQTFYIVMELVRGTDLKTAINQRGALNQRKAAEIASQVCAALTVAHGYDIIHRDIKPHNIMVQPDGNAKVMDFGIARANGSSVTQTGSVLGTAYYVSPEQAQGKELTAATDIYSLGIVLYEAVTGKLPFEGADAVTVALKHVNQQAMPPSMVNPDIDPDLESIIMKAIAKNPADRYNTADAMRTALNNYLSGRPVDQGVSDSQAKTTVIAAVPSRRQQGGEGAADGELIDIEPRRPRGGNDLAKVSRTTVMPAAQASLPYATNSNEAYEGKRKKSRAPAIVVGVLAGLAVIGFVVFLVMYLMGGDDSGTRRVPSVIGLTEREATQRLSDNDLEVGEVTTAPSETVESGKVISSDPRANSVVDKGSSVDLVISTGSDQPKPVQVPNIINMTPEAAEQLLAELGLSFRSRGERWHDSIEAGLICEQDPSANTIAYEGSVVNYYISRGRESSTIPNVIGKSVEDGERYIEDAGYVSIISPNRVYNDTVPAGYVVDQTPVGGTTAIKGTEVTLIISDGPERVMVPLGITDMTYTEAVNALGAAGFVVMGVTIATSNAADVGKVYSCDPAPGDLIRKGSTVTVTYYVAALEPPEPPIPPGP